jgi:gamma-D-glutamyl-L-lysine dipeptidyl-peptidase
MVWMVMRPYLTVLVGVLASLAVVLAAMAAAKAQTPGGQREAYVDVGVATLWVQPRTDRRVDKWAVSDPSDMRLWQRSMSLKQERWLVGRLETQALYGQKVAILKRSGRWAKVAVEGQPTPRNDLGYPGWVPTRQLTDGKRLGRYEGRPLMQVKSPTAWLYDTDGLDRRFMEVSYATRLPLLAKRNGAVEVATPNAGYKWLRASDVSAYPSQAAIPEPTGERLVDSAKEFLGVPYLWAGASGFGFDCSGLTYLVYRAHGITIPRDTLSREDLTNPPYGGRPVRSYANLKPGDLAYFAYHGGTGAVHHVGMYIGGGRMIHSPSPGSKVSIVRIAHSGWLEEYAGAVRYL